ncbi:nitrogenase stabilizing/protective protein NifW [Sinorhizobium psoraleae]|uniref:Nitrogenase-stabilizing/protective protein NifW n=1 Tax=Sinorhizobium psoraleae TaxID=520838 RepID=A0ABT4KMP9_9HYPH|nr:nitrogenase stabilizing/protective protein NifW [Sinorhizobium psoraleae]MCZ4093129.1 nitrogenase stabilizing/protective protein NifW [Sinorhizobium psoraleae]
MIYDNEALSSDAIIARLKRLSAAEEFFEALGVSYEPKVLDVSRLHIMKRMGQYLAEQGFSDPDAVAAADRARDALERAYADFATTSPLSHRVFRVLEARDPTKAAAPSRTFVSLDSVLNGSDKYGSNTTIRCLESDTIVAPSACCEPKRS